MKWGDKIRDPRKQLLKDSGIMYHSIGSIGEDYWRSWMLSQEFQIMEGHKGKIQIQSEAAEIFYKDIKIRKLETFPSGYEEHFN